MLPEDNVMLRTITLTLPDDVLQPVQRVAQATRQSVETLLVAALHTFPRIMW